jgi:hypothetical protein
MKQSFMVWSFPFVASRHTKSFGFLKYFEFLIFELRMLNLYKQGVEMLLHRWAALLGFYYHWKNTLWVEAREIWDTWRTSTWSLEPSSKFLNLRRMRIFKPLSFELVCYAVPLVTDILTTKKSEDRQFRSGVLETRFSHYSTLLWHLSSSLQAGSCTSKYHIHVPGRKMNKRWRMKGKGNKSKKGTLG